MKEPRRKEVPDTDRHLNVIKIAVFFLLCSMIAALGPTTYLLLHDAEINAFLGAFKSVSLLMSNSVYGSIQRKITMGNLVNAMFIGAFETSKDQILPNFTFVNFEDSMVALGTVADLRYIAFAPLVNSTTRDGWEAYAKKNVYKLNGPPSLNTSINGSWTVADGIYNLSSSGKRSRDRRYPWYQSSHPHWMFPVWQVAPIAQNADLVMLDSYAVTFENRHRSVEQVLKYMRPVFTNFVQFVQDSNTQKRPSTILFSPILSTTDGDNIVGLSSGGFSWDAMLSGILNVDYKQVNCVITADRKFIFS